MRVGTVIAGIALLKVTAAEVLPPVPFCLSKAAVYLLADHVACSEITFV